jgi:hypothetical protein
MGGAYSRFMLFPAIACDLEPQTPQHRRAENVDSQFV